ncbi:MAG TPA: hypothetical protein PLU07_09270 [Ferruginibacter sp.]|nr:hypothetical protein [Ferruginibacter sp.]
MKKSFQKLSTLFLAAAAMFSPSTTQVKASNEVQQSHQKQRELQQQQIRTANEYVRHMVGGVPVMTVGTGGIPPEIYGRFYVKRGTHKRTNARKRK